MPTIVRKARSASTIASTIASTTAKTTKTSAKPSVAATAGSIANSSPDWYEQVRGRAYELYVQRGRLDGFAEQDWLQAESELRTARIA